MYISTTVAVMELASIADWPRPTSGMWVQLEPNGYLSGYMFVAHATGLVISLVVVY
jgi:hypothetical protein